MHVHACHAWHTWDGMDSVVDLTQDKQPVLDSTTVQMELTRQVKMAGAETVRRTKTTVIPARRQFSSWEEVVVKVVLRARPWWS